MSSDKDQPLTAHRSSTASRATLEAMLKRPLDMAKRTDRDMLRMQQETDARNGDLEHFKREQLKQSKG